MDGDLTDFSHTTCNNADEWWQVDLSPGTDTQLTQIVVYNRNGCGDRLSNFTISVIDSNGNTVWSQVYNQPTTDGEAIVFDTGTISGEYVKIQKNDSNFLHLAEVQVFDYDSGYARRSHGRFQLGQSRPRRPRESKEPIGPPVGRGRSRPTIAKTTRSTSPPTTASACGSTVSCYATVGSRQAPRPYSGTIHLDAGQSYSIRMEYYQGGGPSRPSSNGRAPARRGK